MVKSLKFIVKTNVFDRLEGCMCERWRYHKNIKSETQIRPKFDETSIQISCSKKGYPKHNKSSKKWLKKKVKSDTKLEKHSKNYRNKYEFTSQARGTRGVPGDVKNQR